jgi:phosphoribosyl 1,2-cyclic phosphodiesterase
MPIPAGRPLALTLALQLTCGAWIASAQQNIDFAKLELQTVKVTDGLYVLMGGPAQGNIAVSVGSDGVFLVDSMYGQMHQKIVNAVKALSPQPIRYVVNTHLHGDHTAGNAAMAKLGAVIISHENMRKRMADAQNAPGTLPVVTYSDSLTLHFNGEEIQIYHPAPAHTDGDSIIYFRNANVVHVGDIPASLSEYRGQRRRYRRWHDGCRTSAHEGRQARHQDHSGPSGAHRRVQGDRTAVDDVCGRPRSDRRGDQGREV